MAVPLFFVLGLLATVGECLESNLTKIDTQPCVGTISDTVSQFSSDIYVVAVNFSLCTGDSWQLGSYNGIRVFSQGEVNYSHPIVFTARQGSDGVVGWTIPLRPEGFTLNFSMVEHTLCPVNITSEAPPTATPLFYLDVFSSSLVPLQYNITVEPVPHFSLSVCNVTTVEVGAASPQVFYFKFPKSVRIVTVEATTDNKRCAIISIQNNSCPFNDLLETARSKGIFQTMSTGAYLTVKEEQVKDKEFLVVIIATNYSICHRADTKPLIPIINVTNNTHEDRFEQIINVTVNKLPPTPVIPIVLPLLTFLAVYVLALTILGVSRNCNAHLRTCFWIPPFTIRCTKPHKKGQIDDDNGEDDDDDDVTAHEEGKPLVQRKTQGYNSIPGTPPSPPVINDTDDEEGEERSSTKPSPNLTNALENTLEHSLQLESNNSNFNLPRMFKHKFRKLKVLYSVYSWNTITVGIFYGLPAFQLVLSQQQSLNVSGDQDKCYYNFRCAYPIGIFSAFNNVWSNVGYVLLGVLFLIIITIRRYDYTRQRKNDREYVDTHGIPQFFGLYYAMGIGLIIEGFMSAFYHVCPTGANFQFDTAFMFIISGLFLVKTFQSRHPDIHTNAFVAFFSFAVVIFFTLLGIYFDQRSKLAVRVVMLVIVLVLVFIFLISFYYFHRWELQVKTLVDFFKFYCTHSPRKWAPTQTWRCAILALIFIINIVVGVLAVKFLDVATAILAFFLVNLLLFLIAYTFQKVYHRERFTLAPLLLLVLVAGFWCFSFYFFFNNVTDWQLTPAESRGLNRPCIALGFYDHHDIWHFLSASAMFCSFLFFMTLDDGLVDVKISNIKVF